MTDTNKQLAEITEKLDFLIGIHTQRTRRPRQRQSTSDRRNEMLVVFNYLATLPDKKKAQQRFTKGTYHMGLGNATKGHVEIVPRAILVNRASMRGAFKPTKEEVLSKSSSQIAAEVLDSLVSEGKLVEHYLDKTHINVMSHVLCVFSPKWAKLKIPGYAGDVATVVEEEEDEPVVELVDLNPKKTRKPLVEESVVKPQQSFTDYLKEKGDTELLDTITGKMQKPLEMASAEQETASEEERRKL